MRPARRRRCRRSRARFAQPQAAAATRSQGPSLSPPLSPTNPLAVCLHEEPVGASASLRPPSARRSRSVGTQGRGGAIRSRSNDGTRSKPAPLRVVFCRAQIRAHNPPQPVALAAGLSPPQALHRRASDPCRRRGRKRGKGGRVSNDTLTPIHPLLPHRSLSLAPRLVPLSEASATDLHVASQCSRHGTTNQAPAPPPIQTYGYAAPPNPVTDLTHWRLRVSHGSHGRHEWVYLASEEERQAWPMTEEDRYWIGLKTVRACRPILPSLLALPTSPSPTPSPARAALSPSIHHGGA